MDDVLDMADEAYVVGIYDRIFGGRATLIPIWQEIIKELDLAALAELSKKYPLLRTFLSTNMQRFLQSPPEAQCFLLPVRRMCEKRRFPPFFSNDCRIFKGAVKPVIEIVSTNFRRTEAFNRSTKTMVVRLFYPYWHMFRIGKIGSPPCFRILNRPWLVMFHQKSNKIFRSCHYAQLLDLIYNYERKCIVIRPENVSPLPCDDDVCFPLGRPPAQYNIGKNLIIDLSPDSFNTTYAMCITIVRNRIQLVWEDRSPIKYAIYPIWIASIEGSETYPDLYLTSVREKRRISVRFHYACNAQLIDEMILDEDVDPVGGYCIKNSEGLWDFRIMVCDHLYSRLMVFEYTETNKPCKSTLEFRSVSEFGSPNIIADTLWEPFRAPPGFVKIQLRVEGSPMIFHISLEKLEGKVPFTETDFYFREKVNSVSMSFPETRAQKTKRVEEDSIKWTFQKDERRGYLFFGENEKHIYRVSFRKCLQEDFWTRFMKRDHMVNYSLNNHEICQKSGCQCPKIHV